MNRQLFQYHPEFGYLFIPGLKLRVEHESGGYLLQTNQAGFRSSREFLPQREAGKFRILLFGDSYTAGDGVSNRDRYSDLLEEVNPRLEVFNFGMPGTGTDQQYLIWKSYSKYYDHDLVIVAVMVENIRRVASRYRIYDVGGGKTEIFAKPFFILTPEGTLKRGNNPVKSEPINESDLSPEERVLVDRGGELPQLREFVNSMGGVVKDKIQKLLHYQPVPAYDSADNKTWLLMRSILLNWVQESEKPLIIMPLPLYQHVEETADSANYQARFKELGRESGALIYDPLPDLQRLEKKARRQLRFLKDVHPTPLFHRILAQSLAPVICSSHSLQIESPQKSS